MGELEREAEKKKDELMNNIGPNLAAEILLNLKPTQSAAVLSAMDSQKAA